jgi:hypothetical protein
MMFNPGGFLEISRGQVRAAPGRVTHQARAPAGAPEQNAIARTTGVLHFTKIVRSIAPAWANE